MELNQVCRHLANGLSRATFNVPGAGLPRHTVPITKLLHQNTRQRICIRTGYDLAVTHGRARNTGSVTREGGSSSFIDHLVTALSPQDPSPAEVELGWSAGPLFLARPSQQSLQGFFPHGKQTKTAAWGVQGWNLIHTEAGLHFITVLNCCTNSSVVSPRDQPEKWGCRESAHTASLPS